MFAAVIAFIQKYGIIIAQALDWFPGIKKIIGGLLAFFVGALAAWNGAATEAGFPDLVWQLPDWVSQVIIGILGLGVAAGGAKSPSKPQVMPPSA